MFLKAWRKVLLLIKVSLFGFQISIDVCLYPDIQRRVICRICLLLAGMENLKTHV